MEKRMSLSESLVSVSNLLSMLGSDEHSDDQILAMLDQAETSVMDAVDRRKYVIRECDVRIETGKKMIADIQKHLKILERTKDRVKQSTLEVMDGARTDSLKDSLGRKVYVKTSPGSIDLDISVKDVSFRNCLDIHGALLSEVQPYLVTKVVKQLDTQLLLEDLRAGKELSFAKLSKKRYVVGL